MVNKPLIRPYFWGGGGTLGGVGSPKIINLPKGCTVFTLISLGILHLFLPRPDIAVV